MLIFLIPFILAALIFLILLLLFKIPICNGGELFSGCGKILYPWTKKIKLPSGRYCCTSCYARDLEMFAKMHQPSDGKLQFTENEEQFDLGDDE